MADLVPCIFRFIASSVRVNVIPRNSVFWAQKGGLHRGVRDSGHKQRLSLCSTSPEIEAERNQVRKECCLSEGRTYILQKGNIMLAMNLVRGMTKRSIRVLLMERT